MESQSDSKADIRQKTKNAEERKRESPRQKGTILPVLSLLVVVVLAAVRRAAVIYNFCRTCSCVLHRGAGVVVDEFAPAMLFGVVDERRQEESNCDDERAEEDRSQRRK